MNENPAPSVNEESHVAKAIRESQEEIAAKQAKLAFLLKHREFFEEHRLWVSDCGNFLDINWPSHDESILTIRHFGGSWKKEYAGTSINYVATVEGVPVRIYAGEPPPNCKIVEEEVVIPARTEIIPERVEKRSRLVCVDKAEVSA
jgi:hypothetical protein